MLMRLFLSFLVGGALCLPAQVLLDRTSLTPARILVLYVCSGVLLGATGLFTPLFDAVGCGVSVPLLGFGASIAKGVKEAIDESGALGILTGGFTAAAAGCSAALLFGYLSALLFRSRAKSA